MFVLLQLALLVPFPSGTCFLPSTCSLPLCLQLDKGGWAICVARKKTLASAATALLWGQESVARMRYDVGRRRGRQWAAQVRREFPHPLTEGVDYCMYGTMADSTQMGQSALLLQKHFRGHMMLTDYRQTKQVRMLSEDCS